jgi:hypothetical protein
VELQLQRSGQPWEEIQECETKQRTEKEKKGEMKDMRKVGTKDTQLRYTDKQVYQLCTGKHATGRKVAGFRPDEVN